jgi:hypothetical protein
MGTTNTTSGSNTTGLNFNPVAQQIYNSLIGGGSNILQGYMNNPFGNPAYTMGAQQSQAGAQQAGNNNMQALNQNALTNGLTGQAGAGFMSAQKAQTGRANQSMSSQANIQNVMQAIQRQMSAAGTGMSFSPQLTGQTGSFQQTSSTGGLGTWLPQLLGGLGGAALSGLTMSPGSPGSNINGTAPGWMNGPNLQAPTGAGGLSGTLPGFSGGSLSSLLSNPGNGAPSPLMGMFPQQGGATTGGW